MSQSQPNWGAAIGPGIPAALRRQQQQRDDAAFIAALKAISPEELRRMSDSRAYAAEQEAERDRQRYQRANDPQVHCNRFEEPGNVKVNTTASVPAVLAKSLPNNFGAHLTIPEDVLQRAAQEFPEHVRLEPSHELHTTGSEELPEVLSPEEWTDRYIHMGATHCIMLMEAGFVSAIPATNSTGTFISTDIDFVVDNRAWDIVKQRYLDVGWREVGREVRSTNKSTRVWLYFP